MTKVILTCVIICFASAAFAEPVYEPVTKDVKIKATETKQVPTENSYTVIEGDADSGWKVLLVGGTAHYDKHVGPLYRHSHCGFSFGSAYRTGTFRLLDRSPACGWSTGYAYGY